MVVVTNIIVTKVISKDEDDVRRGDIITSGDGEKTEQEQTDKWHGSTADCSPYQ